MSAPRILLTRPRGDSEALAQLLARAGWRALIWPVLEIAPTGARPDFSAAQAALFTSANAARLCPAPPPAAALPALCVGPRTAVAARASGFAEVHSAGGDAAALAALAADRLSPQTGPLAFARGERVAGDLAGDLRRRGFAVAETIVYAARPGGPPPPAIAAALADGALNAAAFYSPRSAALFRDALAGQPIRLGAACAVAISPAAAEPLAGLGFGRLRIAESPDGAAMLAAIAALRRK